MGRDEGFPASSAQRRPIVNNSAGADLPPVNMFFARLPDYESLALSFRGLPGDLRVRR